MSQCEVVDKQTMLNSGAEVGHSANGASTTSGGLFPQSPLSLFSGIIPGNIIFFYTAQFKQILYIKRQIFILPKIVTCLRLPKYRKLLCNRL